MTENKQRIVVMGGSFNPPTLAHLKLMQAAVDGIGADMGVFTPTNHTYVKIKMRRAKRPDEVYSEEVRREMLMAMCEGDARLTVDDVEYHREGGKNYETMEYLQQKYPDAELYFVLGGDKLNVFPRWHRGREFMENFKLLVFRRNGIDPEGQIMENPRMREYRESFVILPEPEGVQDISSTRVRAEAMRGGSVEGLVHEGVARLMREYPIGMEDVKDMNRIDCFRGVYGFLSNFYNAPVTWEGLTYLNSEAAFQAAKVLTDEERRQFMYLDPSRAKRMGRRVNLRSDWEQVKVGIMEEIVRAKFTQNPELGALLVATGDAELIEGNTWNDTCWGVDTRTGKGENNLGKILMKVRAELAAKS